MYNTIFPTQDATIYENVPLRNTGTDQILELIKITSGSPVMDIVDDHVYYTSTSNTRILMKFDLSTVSASLNSGKIGYDARYYLVMYATTAQNTQVDYNIYAYPLSGSWVNGTGYYNNNPEVQNGVSWRYKSGKLAGDNWDTGSLTGNKQSSYSMTAGGGVWYTGSGYEASQSIQFTSPDLRMDVTDIVHKWLSGSVANDGFIIKFNSTVEQDDSIMGMIQYFSKETHTIYVPRMDIMWNSWSSASIASVTEINTSDYVVYAKNLREHYLDTETPKLRLGVRPRYPVPTYSTSSHYMTNYRLPTSSYFAIYDSVTDSSVIPFDTVGTKVNCDADGNFIRLDMNPLMPERYYKLVIKVATEGGDYIDYFGENMYFKVNRNM